MLTGTTSTGFAYKVEVDALDDYELLELLCESDKGDARAMLEAMERLLGKEQKEALKKHVRNEEGKVSAKRMMEEMLEILKSHGEGKN